MAILNITYNGLSADFPFQADEHLSDADIRRIAVELVRTSGLRGMNAKHLSANAFANYVVDRLTGPSGERRIYLRPKVPFGAAEVAA